VLAANRAQQFFTSNIQHPTSKIKKVLDRVTIGSNVCISQRAFLCTGTHDFSKDTFDLITRSIVIGDGCWVAAQAFVGPGAVLPPGAMVKAGEVWKTR